MLEQLVGTATTHRSYVIYLNRSRVQAKPQAGHEWEMSRGGDHDIGDPVRVGYHACRSVIKQITQQFDGPLVIELSATSSRSLAVSVSFNSL